jgi:hypothetical protein
MITIKNMFWLMTTPLLTALACWLIWALVIAA